MADWLLLAAAAAGEQSIPQQIAETFGWNAKLFVSQVISFCLVAFLLTKFAYAPIQKLLADRQRKIAEGLANAEKTRQELARAQAKAEELLAQANTQANKHIEEARQAAARVLEVETQKAVAAANDIVNKARQASEAELVRMKAELRREVGRLVAETTAKVAGKVLSADDQQRLAEEANRHLAA